MKKKITSKKESGFTLIEALVAVFIFSSAVVFLITIAGRGLLAMNTAEKQTTAYFLAQEGLEIVHSLRNEAFLNQLPWLDGIQACVNNSNGCGFHIDTSNQIGAPFICSGDSCRIGVDTSEPVKFYHGGSPTPFTRIVRIRHDGSDMIQVNSTVSWQQGNFTRQVVLNEFLREWVISAPQTNP